MVEKCKGTPGAANPVLAYMILMVLLMLFGAPIALNSRAEAGPKTNSRRLDTVMPLFRAGVARQARAVQQQRLITKCRWSFRHAAGAPITRAAVVAPLAAASREQPQMRAQV